MKITALVLLALALTGCSPKIVYVPVSSCPQPPPLSMPPLAINMLPAKPETAIALKALAADHVTLRGTLEQCIVTLDGYRKDAPK